MDEEEDQWASYNPEPAEPDYHRRPTEEDTHIPEAAQHTQGADPWAAYNPQSAQGASDPWAAYNPQPAAGEQKPEAEGTFGHILRTAAHNLIPGVIGTAAGFAAAPFTGGLGSIPVGVGGFLAAQKAQEWVGKQLGFDDSQQMAVNAATNPKTQIAAEVVSALPFFGVGAASRATRAVGALAGTALEAGSQYLEKGTVDDPLRLAAGAVGGATLTKPTGVTQAIESRVGSVLGRNIPHGTAGPDAAAGTAQEAKPTTTEPTGDPQNRTTLGTGAQETGGENLNTRDYGKDSKPSEPGAGVNVTDNGVDPTVASTFEQSSPEIDAAVRKATGTEAPPPRTEVPPPRTEAPPSGAEAPPTRPTQAEPGYWGQKLDEEFPRAAPRPESEPARTGQQESSERPYEAAPAAAEREPATTAATARTTDDTLRGPVMDARLDEIGAGGTAAAPAKLRETAAQLREQGQEGRAKSFERAADSIENDLKSRGAAQQQQQQQPGEMPAPTGGGQVPPPRPGAAGAGVPPSEKPTLHMPATKSDLAQGLFPSLRRMFMPMVSESAQKAGAAIREATGPLARLKEQARTRFTDDLHQVANKMDEPAFNKFVDAYESGNAHTLPKEQQALAKALERNYADFWNEIKKLPGTSKMEATRDFLTHMYDNSNGQVDKFVSDWHGGGGGSLRKRTHPTFADARAAGLTQLSNNPIEHFGRYAESISGHIAQRRVMADLEGQGRIVYSAPKVEGASGSPQPLVKGGPPEGYAEIKAPWAEKNGKRAYAPRDVAETLNQYYAAGLRNAATKNIYEFAQRAKNSWTAVELGLSAYHGTTMAVEATNTGMARALQMAARGDFAGATKQLVKAPFEGATSYLYGRELRKFYQGKDVGERKGLLDSLGQTFGYDKQAQNPTTQKILDVFTKANIQPGNKPLTSEAVSGATMREQDMSKLGNIYDAYKRGSLTNEITNEIQKAKDTHGLSIPKSMLDATTRGVQTLSKPLFEHYIPELKLGSMMKDMEAWLHANPKATEEQTLSTARKIADSTDNRMGEMNYDNLFINKTAKDIGMLALRSFAFTVGGPVREIGGGAASLARGALKGQNRLSLSSEHFDPRAAYAMAFLPTIAAISATYQYLRTGKGPDDWRDLVTPKTGGMIKSVGQMVPERVLVPGYHKDFLGYFVNPAGPTHELAAKMAAPWTAIGEQITGKDWRDKDIVPPKASLLENIGARAKALGSHMLPIGPKQLAEGSKQGSALTVPEQMIGVRTPGAYMLNPQGLDRYLTSKAQRDWRANEKQVNRTRIDTGLPPLPLRQPAVGGR